MKDREDTYASRIQFAMEARGLTLRNVAEATGRSYEHIRSIARSYPTPVGRPLNRDLCTLLGLPEGELWSVAALEKAAQKLSVSGADRAAVLSVANSDVYGALLTDWLHLDPSQRAEVLTIVAGMAALNRARQRS